MTIYHGLARVTKMWDRLEDMVKNKVGVVGRWEDWVENWDGWR